jgi:hypothetical protein
MTIGVFALDPETQMPLEACSDGFIVAVDNDTPPSLTYTPPEEEGPPPSLTYTPPEEEPPPSLTYTPPTVTPPEEEPIPTLPAHTAAPDEPVQPAPITYVAATTSALHAAPATPQTGPGLIIPLIGVALGGAWMRRKRK